MLQIFRIDTQFHETIPNFAASFLNGYPVSWNNTQFCCKFSELVPSFTKQNPILLQVFWIDTQCHETNMQFHCESSKLIPNIHETIRNFIANLPNWYPISWNNMQFHCKYSKLIPNFMKQYWTHFERENCIHSFNLSLKIQFPSRIWFLSFTEFPMTPKKKKKKKTQKFSLLIFYFDFTQSSMEKYYLKNSITLEPYVYV